MVRGRHIKLELAWYSSVVRNQVHSGELDPPALYSIETRDIRQSTHVVSENGTDFTGRNMALLAHYDHDGLVDPYVAHYAAHLKEAGFGVILCSADRVAIGDAQEELFDAVLYRSCPGYDFTSWKMAFDTYPSLFQANEVIIANDSVFAPIHPLRDVHARMNGVSCDFWGLSRSFDKYVSHLQSFYIVFRKQVLGHDAFRQFWERVGCDKDREAVISRYEIYLTRWLEMHGFTSSAYVSPQDFDSEQPFGPVYLYWRQLLRHHGFPCLKRNIILGTMWWINIRGWEKELANSDYDISLIKNYIRRIKRNRESKVLQGKTAN